MLVCQIANRSSLSSAVIYLKHALLEMAPPFIVSSATCMKLLSLVCGPVVDALYLVQPSPSSVLPTLYFLSHARVFYPLFLWTFHFNLLNFRGRPFQQEREAFVLFYFLSLYFQYLALVYQVKADFIFPFAFIFYGPAFTSTNVPTRHVLSGL